MTLLSELVSSLAEFGVIMSLPHRVIMRMKGFNKHTALSTGYGTKEALSKCLLLPLLKYELHISSTVLAPTESLAWEA